MVGMTSNNMKPPKIDIDPIYLDMFKECKPTGKLKMKNLKELQYTTSEVTDNILEGNFDLCDYCHQYADSDERVIYYHKAEEYVLEHEDRDELEDEWKEYGFEFTDLSTLFAQMAFFGVKKEIERDAYKDIMNDLERFRDALDELEKELDHDNPNEGLEDDIYELENAIEELEEYE